MKKILIISNMYPTTKAPHYGIFVRESEILLRENGFIVEVSSMKKTNNKIFKLINYLVFYIKTTALLLFKNYDYIYIHFISLSSLPAILVNKLGKQLKIIANIHGNDLVPDNYIDSKRLKWSYQLIKISNKIVVPSEYFKEKLRNTVPQIAQEIIIYPSSGVNTKVFYPKKVNHVKSKNIKIGFVSRIEKDKGWDLFLKLVENLIIDFPDCEFFMVGEGSEESKCRELSIKLGVDNNINFIKFMNHEKLSDFFNEIDLFIFPTYRKSESLGLVGIEAMACGKIVVGPDRLGPSSYLVNDKNSVTFKTKDIESLIKNVRKVLMLSTSKKVEISKEAIKTANNYSRDNTKERLIRVFSD